jgi:aspartate aminotransferase
VLNYPSNPTGRTYERPALSALAEVARRHRVLLLSDEIYGKLHHEGAHESIVPHYPEGTILSTGLSKWCGAGGWRLGIFVFPRRLRWLLDAMAAVASETYTTTSAPIQHAAVRAFTPDASIESYLAGARRVLSSLNIALASTLAGTGARLLPAEGGFYLFPDFSPLRDRLAARGIRTSQELCEGLLDETGVAVLPGSEFGRPADELTTRIAFVDFDGRAALEAAASRPGTEPLDAAFARQVAPRLLGGIERMAAWLAR